MTITKRGRKSIELVDSKILYELYLNSRVSINDLAKKFGVSHHTMGNRVRKLEERYGLCYTVEVNTELLGFSEPRVLEVRFEKVPELRLLKKVLGNDPFVQNAYLISGDFDLILHVVGLNYIEYSHWEFKFRMGFSNYKPRVKAATLNHMVEGFIPINSKLIHMSKEINSIEKKILIKLIENSRIRVKELSETLKLSQMKVLYAISKLEKRGIIVRFSTFIQNPDKRIFLVYSIAYIPNKEHHHKALPEFLNRIIKGEQENEITTDYSVVCDTSGHFDAIYFCNFKDGTTLNERGSAFLKRTWESESPVVEQGIMTELIAGKWPFNANNYTRWRIELEKIENNPIRFETY